MRKHSRPLGAERVVEGEKAGGTPRRPVGTWLPTVLRFLHLQRRDEREVC